MESLITVAAGLVTLLVVAFLLSILQGAGRPIGEVGFIEAAPWLARIVPSVLLRITLVGRESLRRSLDEELQSLIAEEFAVCGSATDRASAILFVFRKSIGILRRAQEMRRMREPRVRVGTKHALLTKEGSPNRIAELPTSEALEKIRSLVIDGVPSKVLDEYFRRLDENIDCIPIVTDRMVIDDPDLAVEIDPTSELGLKLARQWKELNEDFDAWSDQRESRFGR